MDGMCVSPGDPNDEVRSHAHQTILRISSKSRNLQYLEQRYVDGIRLGFYLQSTHFRSSFNPLFLPQYPLNNPNNPGGAIIVDGFMKVYSEVLQGKSGRADRTYLIQELMDNLLQVHPNNFTNDLNNPDIITLGVTRLLTLCLGP